MMALNQQQQHWVEKAQGLASEIADLAAQYDREACFPEKVFERLRASGLLALAVPKEYGGHGTADGNVHLTAYLVTEAISRACPSTGWDLIIHYHQCGAVARLGNEEQKQRILGDVAKNGALMGSLGSEVDHRQSVTVGQETRKLVFQADMMPVDGGFCVNASKHFCSNGPVADYLLYWSMAPGSQSGGEGLTLSIVTRDSAGLTFHNHGWDDIIGLRSSVSWSATLKDVFIPWQNVLGEPADFVHKDPYTLELSQAFQLVGAGQGAMDCIVKTLRDRPFLQKEEGLMVLLGELESALQAARGSCLYANMLWEQKNYGAAARASLSAHHTARETALLVATKGFDIIGTRSLFKTMPLERIWRDIRTASLHTRESQLLRLVADAVVSGHYAPKQKYGSQTVKARSWRELGLTH
ncbi:hypothetical protein BTJ39_02465 [Izhakiella australiensis]|uniref:Acyl-CoA dehydrogenase n=1 Tax=Izhakiella australiensis TaxID=1926881 RepID=A0A1S8YT68_9GAMM|nr:acyl-CoA dehydrogenase family protein [Izhakiella australiensis]OON42038.1 hypothetical protein BTJ39_02465 [Izhakiella australiensis]